MNGTNQNEDESTSSQSEEEFRISEFTLEGEEQRSVKVKNRSKKMKTTRHADHCVIKMGESEVEMEPRGVE